MERPVEGGDLGAILHRCVAIVSAGTSVPLVDPHLGALRPQPLRDQLRIDPGPKHLVRRRIEVSNDADRRHVRVGLDSGLLGLLGSGLMRGVRAHDVAPFWWWIFGLSSMAAST